MKRKSPGFVLDMYDESVPRVGDVYRDVGARSQVLGYCRILEVRRVNVRTSRGEVSRWRLKVERLEGNPPEGCRFTVTRHTPRRRRDRFSPLLDAQP